MVAIKNFDIPDVYHVLYFVFKLFLAETLKIIII